jgi:hypothetical protein
MAQTNSISSWVISVNETSRISRSVDRYVEPEHGKCHPHQDQPQQYAQGGGLQIVVRRLQCKSPHSALGQALNRAGRETTFHKIITLFSRIIDIAEIDGTYTALAC